jgi:hypothetical protein
MVDEIRGTIIRGKYRLLALLGEGANGLVSYAKLWSKKVSSPLIASSLLMKGDRK